MIYRNLSTGRGNNMTVVEFNTKYAQYLEKGHYGLDIDYPAVVEFLDELFEDHLTKMEGFTYAQIKMKYNFCRFYFTTGDIDGFVVRQAIQFLVENTINMLVEK